MIASATAAQSATGSGYGELLVGSLVVLGLVCLAAWVVVRFGLRRMGYPGSGPRPGGVLDVVARVPLEPRRSLYVVEVGGKTLLVGTSEMGLSVLSELDRDAVQAKIDQGKGNARSFADALRAALGRKRA